MQEQSIIEDVYVATQTRDRVILQDRAYKILAELPTKGDMGLSLQGVYVKTVRVNWHEMDSISYWFAFNRNTDSWATAEIWDEGDGTFYVTLSQPSSCFDLG